MHGSISESISAHKEKVPAILPVQIAVGGLLLVCCLFSSVPLTGYLAMLAFGAFSVWLFIVKAGFYVKYLPFVFSSVANIAGCAVCEFASVALPELSAVSHFSGSLPLLSLCWWLFFLMLLLFDLKAGVESSVRERVKDMPSGSPASLVFKIAVCVEMVVILALFLRVYANPSFLMGVDRFEYAALFQQGIWGNLGMWAGFALPLVIIAFRIGNMPWRIACGVALAVYCLFLFWTGEKFGGFFTLFCIIGLCYYDKLLQIKRKSALKLLASLALCLVALICFSVFSHSFTAGEDGIPYLRERLAQQGQLWWGTYEKSKGELHAGEFESELSSLVSASDDIATNVGSQYGVYRIMYLVAPKDVIDRKLASGSRYTEAGGAAMYYYFGFMGPPLFFIAMGLVVAVLQNALIGAIWHLRTVSVFLLTRLQNIISTVFGMLTLHLLVSPLSILTYLVLAAVLIVERLSIAGRRFVRNRPVASKDKICLGAYRVFSWYMGNEVG